MGYGCILGLSFQKFWELKIDNIKVNDKIVLKDVPAILDTGSHLFWGDPSQVLALHKAEGGKAFEDGYYTCEFRSTLIL
jgi:hypothetical protein